MCFQISSTMASWNSTYFSWRAGGDAVALGFDRGGDGDGGVAVYGRDEDGFAAQFGLELLFDARDIAVQVEEQPAQRARGQEG